MVKISKQNKINADKKSLFLDEPGIKLNFNYQLTDLPAPKKFLKFDNISGSQITKVSMQQWVSII